MVQENGRRRKEKSVKNFLLGDELVSFLWHLLETLDQSNQIRVCEMANENDEYGVAVDGSLDGFGLYERIRKIDVKVKVWFITAYEIYYKTLKEVSLKSKEETILDRFIKKPIEINNLVKSIKSELD